MKLAHVLGWIGMLTTLAGAMIAVRQDDIKRMLAYSSLSQLGYIVAAIALMSHLGWVTALYLVANHLLVKGILFLAAAAIIAQTGRRLLSDYGGLAVQMPLTFAAAAVAILSMSGLPPLMGFGGKWLLLSAMIEKGWYGPALMTLLATFVGLIYMAKFIQAIFLGPPRRKNEKIAEAPVALLAAQALLVAGIVVLSLFPKLLIEPVSQAIDPQFASTLVWEGMSLEMIYGYWNPTPVMLAGHRGVRGSVRFALVRAAFRYLYGHNAARLSGTSRQRTGSTTSARAPLACSHPHGPARFGAKSRQPLIISPCAHELPIRAMARPTSCTCSTMS